MCSKKRERSQNLKLFGKESMYQKWCKTPNKKIVLSCLGICSYWHEVNEAFSELRRRRGGGWGKRSYCYFAIGLIFGDFPRRCHIVNPSSCRCCQLAFMPSYVAVSWPCSWSEFYVSVLLQEKTTRSNRMNFRLSLYFCYLFYGAGERTWERGWGGMGPGLAGAFFTLFLGYGR